MRHNKTISLILTLAAALLLFSGCGSSSPETLEHTLTFEKGETVSGETLGVDFDMVGLFFQYTNNSEDTIMPADAIDVKAFQNGKELTVMVFTGQEIDGYIQCDTNVQADTSADVIWLFQLNDTSTVSVECSDGQEFTVDLE